MKYKVKSIYLSEDMLKDLESIAEREERPLTQVVRFAIQNYIRNYNQQ
ncbi:MAG: hypothetical protein N4J56_001778 [Chroococcidiopsis sp. SAG 2025]|nr:ribbon-helix-helix protein, CopG family [Chroococcidiopsis sp. SAG 2025]MDV2992124.1 hypothetical protein [Chroococcidiopsis sp. SAG 2025]